MPGYWVGTIASVSLAIGLRRAGRDTADGVIIAAGCCDKLTGSNTRSARSGRMAHMFSTPFLARLETKKMEPSFDQAG